MTTLVSESGEEFMGIGVNSVRSGHLSRRLHNFDFPTLSWGSHRLFRCLNNNNPSCSTESVPPIVNSPVETTVRSQSMPKSEWGTDLKENSKINVEIAGEEDGLNTEAARPWNLRTRRAACNAPAALPETSQKKRKKNGNGSNINNNNNSDRSGSPSSPVPPSPLKSNYGRLRSENKDKEEEKGERRKFSVSLTKDEIEEDYLMLKGSKPPRRPKKRLRNVQRQLDTLFPGLWLTEVTVDTYKLQDV